MEGLRALADAWGGWVLPVSLHAGLLLLLLLPVDRLLRRRAWPALLAALWALPIVRLLLPPSLGAPWSPARWLPGGGAVPPSPGVAAGGGAVATAPAVGHEWALLLFAAWAAGAVALVVVAGLRARAARRRLLDPAALRPVPAGTGAAAREAARLLGLRTLPPVFVSTRAEGPALLGLLRPVVVLPAEGLPREAVFHALLHELAHLRRRDPAGRALLGAVRVAWWFHPAAWIAAARLDALREACCDQTVASVLREETARYRGTLIAAARSLLRGGGTPRAAGLAMVGGVEGLAERLRALDDGAWRVARRRRALAAAGGAAAGLLLLPGAMSPVGPPPVAVAEASAASAESRPAASTADPSTEEARRIVRDALSGDDHPGCLRIQAALYRLLAAGEFPSADPPSAGGHSRAADAALHQGR